MFVFHEAGDVMVLVHLARVCSVSAEQICDLAEDEIRHQRTDTTVQSIVAAGLKRTGAASNGAGPSKIPANVQ